MPWESDYWYNLTSQESACLYYLRYIRYYLMESFSLSGSNRSRWFVKLRLSFILVPELVVSFADGTAVSSNLWILLKVINIELSGIV